MNTRSLSREDPVQGGRSLARGSLSGWSLSRVGRGTLSKGFLLGGPYSGQAGSMHARECFLVLWKLLLFSSQSQTDGNITKS